MPMYAGSLKELVQLLLLPWSLLFGQVKLYCGVGCIRILGMMLGRFWRGGLGWSDFFVGYDDYLFMLGFMV